MSSDDLNELSRAEDIFLGALGLSDDAKLEVLRLVGEDLIIDGLFRSDGEKFSIRYDLEIGNLENWAIKILSEAGRVKNQ